MILRYLLLASFLAPVVVAQPASHPFFPLAEGNVWIWERSYFPHGGYLRAEVTGWEEGPGAPHWRVLVERQPFSGAPTSTECAVRVSDGALLVEPLGEGGACVELPAGALPSAGEASTVGITGETYTLVVGTRSTFLGSGFRYERFGEGVGFLRTVFQSAYNSSSSGLLVYASTGGTTYGVHPDVYFGETPVTEYMPLAVGRRWVYRLSRVDGYPGSPPQSFERLVHYEVTAALASGFRAAVTYYELDGTLVSGPVSCTLSAQPQGQIVFDGGAACPPPDRATLPEGPQSLRHIAGASRRDYAIGDGTYHLRTLSLHKPHVRTNPYDPTVSEVVTGSPGIGLLRYHYSYYNPSNHVTLTRSFALVHADLGDVVYGTNPVSAGGSTPPPVALGARVHPNPARGAAALAVSLPAPADLTAEVYDVLGRRRLAVPLGVADAGTSVHTLPLAGLAASAYVVVLRGGRSGRATARLTVVD